MAVLAILRWPDPRLSRRCDPVTVVTPAIRRLADDMLATMYAAPGRGLAAPQVGVMLRLFVMDVEWKTCAPAPRVLVNPEIEWVSETLATHDEGCLSIPGVVLAVTRPSELRMRWTSLDGKAYVETFTGFSAVCAQHEFDHLEGLVTFDRISPSDCIASVDGGR